MCCVEMLFTWCVPTQNIYLMCANTESASIIGEKVCVLIRAQLCMPNGINGLIQRPAVDSVAFCGESIDV